MISLPDNIRPGRFAAVHQFESIAVGFAALMCEGEQVGGQAADDVVDDRVAGGRFTQRLSYAPHLAVHRRHRERRLLQSKAFDGLFDLD